MSAIKVYNLLLLLFVLVLVAYVAEGSRNQIRGPSEQSSLHHPPLHSQISSRRLMIGSTAPTCTYNECRGCKYRCRAEQVPVEGNDPINSAYHYRCVCQR